MRNIFLGICCLMFFGCATNIPSQQVEPVQSGQRVTISDAVLIIEVRPPFGIKLQWRLLPGNFVEKYRTPTGRFFQSEGNLVEFTPSIGSPRSKVGGFVLSADKPGIGTLYVLNEGGAGAGFGVLTVAIAQSVAGVAGDFVLVTDFELNENLVKALKQEKMSK